MPLYVTVHVTPRHCYARDPHSGLYFAFSRRRLYQCVTKGCSRYILFEHQRFRNRSPVVSRLFTTGASKSALSTEAEVETFARLRITAVIFFALGLASLCALPFWARSIVRHQPQLDLLYIQPMGSAFDEDPQIPSAEFRAKYNRATRLLSTYRSSLETSQKQRHWASWAAFALTSFITVLAGYLGLDQAADSKTDKKDARLASPPLQTSRRRKRVTALMGVMAALASSSTALSNRLELQEERQWKLATDLNSGLSALRVEWFKAKTKEEALIVIGRLDNLLLPSVSD